MELAQLFPCLSVVMNRVYVVEVSYLLFGVEEAMTKSLERTRALTTLLRYRGGSITLAKNDATQSELQRMLQQLVSDGLVELVAP